jgi:hypothetical protein
MIFNLIGICGVIWLLTDLFRGKGVFLLPEAVCAVALIFFEYFVVGSPDGLLGSILAGIFAPFAIGACIRLSFAKARDM